MVEDVRDHDEREDDEQRDQAGDDQEGAAGRTELAPPFTPIVLHAGVPAERGGPVRDFSPDLTIMRDS